MSTGQNQLKDPQFHVSYCVKQGVIKAYKDRIVPSDRSGGRVDGKILEPGETS